MYICPINRKKEEAETRLLPLKILSVNNSSNEPGGAPRSESEIHMIAGGNHTLISGPNGLTTTTGQPVSYCQRRLAAKRGSRNLLPLKNMMVVIGSDEPGGPSGLITTTGQSVSYCLQALAWLSTYRPGLRRLPWQRQQRDRACPPPETRWSGRSRRWKRHSPEKNG